MSHHVSDVSDNSDVSDSSDVSDGSDSSDVSDVSDGSDVSDSSDVSDGSDSSDVSDVSDVLIYIREHYFAQRTFRNCGRSVDVSDYNGLVCGCHWKPGCRVELTAVL